MKKLLFPLIMLMCFVLSGCGDESEPQEYVRLDKPDTTITATDSDSETARDYGDKKIVNGFWVNECSTGDDRWYRYIPMMSQKNPGIYDFEDSEMNKSMETCTAYNCPDGAGASGVRAGSTYIGFFSNPQLGYNTNSKDEKKDKLDLTKYTESFSLVYDDNKANLEKYDVGCITFALYKELYEDFPQIKMQLYGVPAELLDRKVGDISTCARGHYSSFRKECLDNDFSECLLITEKEITDTGIFYIDYSSLAKKYNCVQYFIVLRFSEEKDCAFYMNGISTYNIKDAEAYEKWKNDNIDSFIAE